MMWQEAKKGMAVAGKVNTTPVEEKAVDDEQFLYASKQVNCYYIFIFL